MVCVIKHGYCTVGLRVHVDEFPVIQLIKVQCIHIPALGCKVAGVDTCTCT